MPSIPTASAPPQKLVSFQEEPRPELAFSIKLFNQPNPYFSFFSLSSVCLLGGCSLRQSSNVYTRLPSNLPLSCLSLLRTEIRSVFQHSQLQRAASVLKRSDKALEFQFNFVETVQIPMLTGVLPQTQGQGIFHLCLRTKAATAILSNIPTD